MEVIKEEVVSYDQMAIIEQYEKVIAYLYPIAQSIPRKHGVVRDMFLRALFKQTEMFYEAGKTNQIGKIYVADAGLAGLRFWLRFLVTPKVKCITKHQHETALVLIANVGSMVNSWIIKRKGQNG
jgi:hypothetical protein